jgi:hypothetical protein
MIVTVGVEGIIEVLESLKGPIIWAKNRDFILTLQCFSSSKIDFIVTAYMKFLCRLFHDALTIKS